MAGVRADGGALDSHRGEDHAETRRRKEHSLTGFHSIINVCFLDPYTAHNTLRFMGIFDNVLSNGISNIKWVKEWRIFLSNLPKIKDAIAKGTTSTMSGVSKSKWYNIALWATTLMMMGGSLFRSWNLGYQYQSYLVTGMCQVPLTYDAFVVKKDRKMMLLNMFYLVNSIIAVYRWKK